jgi:hypothetical protein
LIVAPHLGGGSHGSVARTVERSTANIVRLLASDPVLEVITGLTELLDREQARSPHMAKIAVAISARMF